MQTHDGPTAAITAGNVEFIVQLLEMAKGGLCAPLTQLLSNAVFKNEQLKSLAETVVALVAENEYLKKASQIFAPEIVVKGQIFEFAFGPQNAYKLTIALENDEMCANFVKQLRDAADKLDAKQPVENLPQQMIFKF